MNSSEQIKKHFNKASKTYDEHCGLQQAIGDHLIALIGQHHSSTAKIIDLGCGTGIVTQKLAAAFPHQVFHAIDIAQELLVKANERLPQAKVYESNFDDLHLTNSEFDLVFSNMALQWSADLSSTFRFIKNKLSADGTLAFSIPLAGTLTELKHNYALNHFFSADVIKDKLAECGLSLTACHEEKTLLAFDNLFSALKSIKHVGANYSGKRIHKGLRGKALLNVRMAQRLTYVTGYFIVKKLP